MAKTALVALNSATYTSIATGPCLITLNEGENDLKVRLAVDTSVPAAVDAAHNLSFREGAFTYTGTETVYGIIDPKHRTPGNVVVTVVE